MAIVSLEVYPGDQDQIQLAVFGMFKTSWSASPPCVESRLLVGLSNLKTFGSLSLMS
jgi:hypothetical protein